ncbi:MAG: hypothetical protein IT350_00795 [Deltaproteobacteria bacterium]|nr:hypothetical protein [Deltaproteobacteria bacterium]
MKLWVCHVTRMRPGAICIAGIDPATGSFARPILPYEAGQFSCLLLARNGGPVRLGAVIDFGSDVPRSTPPEVEDRLVRPLPLRASAVLPHGELWAALETRASDSMAHIFGPDLMGLEGASLGVLEGKGRASLGVFRPSAPPMILHKRDESMKESLRVRVATDLGIANLSLTDARFYDDDGRLVPESDDWVERINARFRRRDRALLCVGLTRAYRDHHWLQVNNIVFREPGA